MCPSWRDALSKVSEQGRRLALAQRLFGSEGAALVPLLAEGSGALRSYTQEAARMGAVIDNVTVAAAGDMADSCPA